MTLPRTDAVEPARNLKCHFFQIESIPRYTTGTIASSAECRPITLWGKCGDGRRSNFHAVVQGHLYASFTLAIVRLESFTKLRAKKTGYAQLPKGKIAETTKTEVKLKIMRFGQT
jgi:hypothetical protein